MRAILVAEVPRLEMVPRQMGPERGVDRRSDDVPAAEQEEHHKCDGPLALAFEQVPGERQQERQPERVGKQ